MKIIGKTKGGFLVDMTEREAYNIGGVHSEHVREGMQIEVGTEVKVSDIYSHYHNIAYREKERKSQAEMLRAAASLLESMPSVLIPPPQEPAQATS